MNRMSTEKRPLFGVADDDDDDDDNNENDGGGGADRDADATDGSDSDFDEDEDPDKIEVPGGGRDLETASKFSKTSKVAATNAQLAAGVRRQPPTPITAAMAANLMSAGTSTAKARGGMVASKPLTRLPNVIMPNTGGGKLMAGAKSTAGATGKKWSIMAGPFDNATDPLMPSGGNSSTPGQSSGTVSLGGDSGTGDLGYYTGNAMAASLLAQMDAANAASATANAAAINASTGHTPNANSPNINQFVLQKLQTLIAANPAFLTGGIPTQLLSQMMQQLNQQQQPHHQPSHSYQHAYMQHAQPYHQGHHQHQQQQQQQQHQQPEEEEHDDEEMGVAETYADYWPAKLKIGKKHPDAVVETASLSSVEPTDVFYQLSLPAETINAGLLSALQLESITYASQAHSQRLPDGSRAGFLIGDGAGVGKGRTIAGIIYENYMKGRKKSLWISVSNDLKYDAERDLRDIGAGRIAVHRLNKFKYAKISSSVNGNVKKGVIFSTYSALIGESTSNPGKYRSRLKQLVQWCGGEDFDGCIVFDECHKAKNLCPVGSSKPTKTGLRALEIQQMLPQARVVYASATGASEPRNMAYMVRLGMWGNGTPFTAFSDFIAAVEKRGVGAMEIVAMDMKLRGMYIARQLSFHGVTFKIEEVPLSKTFERVYDESVVLWVEAMQKFTEAAELIDAESRMKKTMWGQFWSAHQRFFKYLCIAAKVNHAVTVAREAIKHGKCVVIGLQSTGEARTLEQLEREDGELSDFVSTAKGVFQSLVEKHFPAPDRNRIQRLLGIEPQKTKLSQILEEAKAKSLQRVAAAAAAAASGSAPKRKNTGAGRMGGAKRNRKSSNGSDDDSDSDRSRGKLGKLGSDDSDNSDAGRRNNDDDDDDDDEAENSDNSDNSDSDEDDEDRAMRNRSDSNCSSDYNPFYADSDSDADPWVGGRGSRKTKKKPKKKKPVKKAATKPEPKPTVAPVSSSSPPKKRPAPQSTQDKIQQLLHKKQTEAKPVHAQTANGTHVQVHTGAPPKDAIERACSMKEELLQHIERLGERLPPNTLDQLIDELGGPDNVAEMTGRKGRVIQTDSGAIQYESRSEQDVPLETLNLTEKQRFMDGTKDVAIISEAASSGISLQSDRRVRNQRRRVHITLELPWSADRAVQQFGRTHRSNQVNAPEYIFLISDLAGERRFASTVAKRLESLGALTHGDRRATETRDLSQFNIDNKYGRTALEAVMRTIMGYEAPLVAPPSDYRGDFFKDVAGALVGVGIIVNSEAMPGTLSLDKDYNNISKFLNRILGMPVELQNRLFKYFTDTLEATIGQAKKLGRFDLGILDLGTAGECVERTKLVRFIRKHATGVAPTELHTVQVERGMIWQEAIDKWANLESDKEGFYLSHQARNGKQTAILCCRIDTALTSPAIGGGAPSSSHPNSSAASNTKTNNTAAKSKKESIMFQVYRPNTGLQFRTESLAEIEKKYKKVQSDQAERHWTQQYDASVNTCSHAYWRGNCRNVSMGQDCEVGLRQRTYTVLSGSVLAVWSRVESVLNSRVGAANKMQVIRLKTTEGCKIVGTLIPKSCVAPLRADLASDAERVEEKQFAAH